jgi:hypothetical protein
MTKSVHPTLNSANKLIRSLGPLEPEAELVAEMVRGLAEQMDMARGSAVGTQSMAIPQIAKQLHETTKHLLMLHPVGDPFLDYLNTSEDDESKEDFFARKASENAERLIGAA